MTMNKLSEFGHSFQIKILYSLLNDKSFLQSISDSLTSEYFDNAAHKWIVDVIINYFSQYHTNPTMEVLKVEMKKEKNGVLKEAIKLELKQAYTSTEEDIEYVKEEFANFCKNQVMKDAILMSADILEQNGEYEDIFRLIGNALKSGEQKEEVYYYERDVESRYTDDARNPIPFPWPTLTNITQGGPGGGDLVIIVSNPKGGKSWGCVAMGGHAARLGINVMHYSLELSEAYTAKRYDAYFTGIEVDELDKNVDEVKRTVSEFSERIRIKKYPPGRTTLTTIEKHLRKQKNQDGWEPGLIIIDYLEKLRNVKDRKDKNEDAGDVFTDAKGLAEVLNVPIVSPAQANRTASDIDIIKDNHLAGTYEKFMIADIIMTVSKKTNIWYMMGNRYGDDGVAFKSSFNRRNGHIVIDSKPYDENAMEEEEEEFRKEVKGKFMRINQ